MKVQVRDGVFETNSSSTHAFNVFNSTEKYEIPESIHIDLNEHSFGWECDTYYDICNKLAYLCILADDYADESKGQEQLEKLKALIYAAGVKDLEIIPAKEGNWNTYVDHGNNATYILDDMLENPDILYDFLFNPLSYIETGNDNDDYEVSYDPCATYAYYKGN